MHAFVRRSCGELRLLCSRAAHHRYDELMDFPCVHSPQGTTVTAAGPLADECCVIPDAEATQKM